VGGQEDIDTAEKGCFAERSGEHGGDDIGGVGNLESCEWIGGTVEDAHLGRELAQAENQVWSEHAAGMEIGDQEMDGARAGFGQRKGLHGVNSRKDEKISVL